jgi:isoleucyl-tRNA synthetase
MDEEKILKFWQENKIFEKSLEKPLDSAQGRKGDAFIFYDGPPFATGLPHYGHILAGIIKDAIPRYQTMKGKHIPRKWGWDCHGLPIENLVEKELNLKSKKDIEEYGIGNFNEKARASVFGYRDDWKKIVPRLGRWVDMKDDYKTMDWKYTESIWWVFKTLHDKGLIYEGHKPMHICPRCETPLANFEVNQGYKDIKDVSVTVKFELVDESPSSSSGQAKTYVLAWTTTPWTLPGNVALAINPDIDYVKVKKEDEYYVFAKTRIEEVFKDKEYEIIEEFKGSELVGKSYKPLFPCTEKYIKEKESAPPATPEQAQASDGGRAFKIYGADFVTTEEAVPAGRQGTGVVHIAPAFGEDDMNLGKEKNLPFVQHVGMDGRIASWVTCGGLGGKQVKPKDTEEDKIAHMRTDIAVIQWLQENNKFFSKENITHSYPHCWRCHTPLLNYATSSWFVEVTKIKDKLIANNQKINWVPDHIKDGRFGKWLDGARDWAISRSRFWGAALPVWKCNSCEEIKVIGSIDDIKERIKKSNNKYFVMRHGESESNVLNINSAKFENNHHNVTDKGKEEIKKSAKKLKNLSASGGIDTIFASDLLRTKESAEMVAEIIGIDKKEIIFDERLREVNVGVFDGKTSEEYHSHFSGLEEKFTKTPPKGENLTELKTRITDFLYEIDEKYSGKNILIISHEYPIWCLFAGAEGADTKRAVEMKEAYGEDHGWDFIKTGEIRELDFTPIPHNKNYEIDLHRPYIDEVEIDCNCGGKMKRIEDVFDCWFESGAMPYGQKHYPFDPSSISSQGSANYGAGNKKDAIPPPTNFPAEFIAEGLDQTRGWFYSLLVLSTGLFDKPAYKNVIVNGMILAEDGQKMSKSLKNYPDPMEIVEKYGADALRYYLLSSPATRAEPLSFSEKGVDEVYKKVISRLRNVVSFYELYKDSGRPTIDKYKFENVLDKWIVVRLRQLTNEITEGLNNYELDKATRPIADFVDDLSTWYIRRSRDRFKNQDKDSQDALATTQYVLLELSKFIAPFMPFLAEEIYGEVVSSQSSVVRKESVHLEEWPVTLPLNKGEQEGVIEAMQEVRKICSLGLEARAKAEIKVRQPLSSLTTKLNATSLDVDLTSLLSDEVNIKKIIFSTTIENEVELDTELTPELIHEGIARELTRAIQEMRKKAGLTPDQTIKLQIETSSEGQEAINKFTEDIKKTTNAAEIKFLSETGGDAEATLTTEEIQINELNINLTIVK